MRTSNDESVRRLLERSELLRRIAKHVNTQLDEVTDWLHAVLARDQRNSPDQLRLDELEADSRR